MLAATKTFFLLGVSIMATVFFMFEYSMLTTLFPENNTTNNMSEGSTFRGVAKATTKRNNADWWTTYTNPQVLQEGCSVTVVFMEPSISEEGLWSIESTVANTIPAETVCFVLQTSACAMEKKNDADAADAADATADDETNSQKETTSNHNHDKDSDAVTKLAQSIMDRAKPLFRNLIQQGNVRITILDHVKYSLNACDDFRPASSVWINYQYWGSDEFIEHVDSDLVLIIQKDSVLCHPLDVNKWRDYAWVGAPWPAFNESHYVPPKKGLAMCTYYPHVWKSWHTKSGTIPPYPTQDDFCDNQEIGPVGNGGLSLRSRSWLRKVIQYCPARYPISGLSQDQVTASQCRAGGIPQEDMYFSAVLRGMDFNYQEEDDDNYTDETKNKKKKDSRPKLASSYEAALFAVETKFAEYFEDRYNLTTNVKQLESMADRLWSTSLSSQSSSQSEKQESGLDRYKRMRTTLNNMIVPIGLHKPWRYFKNDLLLGKDMIRECPYLPHIIPAEFKK